MEQSMLDEILEIPVRAKHFARESSSYALPVQVPYLGMGSSYFAALGLKYMGIAIFPELASEFYQYLSAGMKYPKGVLISQSGKSSEVLWCAERFDQFTAISNEVESPLCTKSAAREIIPLFAGKESYSSSKTYLNTLLALFKGFGVNTHKAIERLTEKFPHYEEQGRTLAADVFEILGRKNVSGIYITGSGPNIATALQAALILSETTKLNFTGLPMAQYDHGPKETAKESIVIQIVAKGNAYDRTQQLTQTIRAAGAHVFTVEEPAASEHESVLHNIIPFNFMAWFLSQKLQVKDIFMVGDKVTEVK